MAVFRGVKLSVQEERRSSMTPVLTWERKKSCGGEGGG
jgi:hypothetical protein